MTAEPNLLTQQMRTTINDNDSNVIYKTVVVFYMDGSQLHVQSTTKSQHKM